MQKPCFPNFTLKEGSKMEGWIIIPCLLFLFAFVIGVPYVLGRYDYSLKSKKPDTTSKASSTPQKDERKGFK